MEAWYTLGALFGKESFKDHCYQEALERGYLMPVRLYRGVRYRKDGGAEGLSESCLVNSHRLIEHFVKNRGMDINSVDKDGTLPLIKGLWGAAARPQGKVELIRFCFREMGADPNATDLSGGTLLHKCRVHPSEKEGSGDGPGRQLIKTLIECGLKVNSLDDCGLPVWCHGHHMIKELEVLQTLAACAWEMGEELDLFVPINTACNKFIYPSIYSPQGVWLSKKCLIGWEKRSDYSRLAKCQMTDDWLFGWRW